MNRHITIRANPGPALMIEDGIDWAIDEGLKQLAEKHSESMDLVNISLLHRPHDGMILVTVIARGTGQIKAVKPKRAKEQATNE